MILEVLMSFVKAFLLLSIIQFVRYLILSGGSYLFFWKWKDNPWTKKNRIQKTDFKVQDMRREFFYSILSSLIFGVVLALAFHDDIGWNFKPLPLPHPTSWLYDMGTLILLILIHDTYFYWMHRLVHQPVLFRRVHKVHHLSKNPSPWASLSFQPAEAVLEIIWILPVQWLIPIQPSIWLAFAFVILAINVMGHLNVEIYPGSWKKNPVLKWLNFSGMHNQHHQFFHGNYGLYFSFWDRMMGTLRS